MNKKINMAKLEEIANENDMPIIDVFAIYSKFNYKIYKRELKNLDMFEIYVEDFDKRTLGLTERYFRRYGGRE